jgi:hypothetical protein
VAGVAGVDDTGVDDTGVDDTGVDPESGGLRWAPKAW